jgi:phosphatidylinositol-bisphosphatase
MIVPGEEEVVIDFTMTLNNEVAQSLNDGTAVLNDDIILRLENGRDYYIKVRGSYARSCFGMALDELVLYSQPIRNIPIDSIKRHELIADVSSVLCIPKELWRMVDALYGQGLQRPELFFRGGSTEEVDEIRECLDTGSPFKNFQVESMADALMSFLANLSSNVIPLYLFPSVEINAENIQAFARRILEEMPPAHYNVFVYLLSFFRECLQFGNKNHLTPTKLAEICVNTLILGNSNQSDPDSTREKGMLLLMIHFLETSSI